MQNQNQQQNLQDSSQMPAIQNHGGHELFSTHESIGSLIGAMEQYMLYQQHIEDPELTTILQRQHTFLTQLYNTAVETLKTGTDPTVPTQTYNMKASTNVVYGMQPAAPKSPSQSVNELTDECLSGFMIGQLKSIASGLTMSAIEITNPVLRRVFADSVPNIIEMAYEVFLYQNKHQYYQVPQLKEQDVQTYTNAFSPVQGNMPH